MPFPGVKSAFRCVERRFPGVLLEFPHVELGFPCVLLKFPRVESRFPRAELEFLSVLLKIPHVFPQFPGVERCSEGGQVEITGVGPSVLIAICAPIGATLVPRFAPG